MSYQMKWERSAKEVPVSWTVFHSDSRTLPPLSEWKKEDEGEIHGESNLYNSFKKCNNSSRVLRSSESYH